MVKIQLYQGHVLAVLSDMADESVHMVCTSPPYWGLRDYGIEPQVWGGRGICVNCEHECGKEIEKKRGAGGERDYGSFDGGVGRGPAVKLPTSSFCCLCGAWRGSYGFEPTLDCLGWATGQPCGQCYVCHTVQIFREVRRVLRKDGVLFLNLGDSYNGSGGAGGDYGLGGLREGQPKYPGRNASGLKRKDLCGVPWRVALALQADGWYLRSDIIWAKPNPMPESCQDRPTTAHEHIFLLTKSVKYFWDAEAVREDFADERMGNPGGKGGGKQYSKNSGRNDAGSLGTGVWLNGPKQGGRNLRSVWTIATAPFPGSHFAVFPPAIPARCIKAGTSEKDCCPKCGAPWRRVVEKGTGPDSSARGSRFDLGKTGIRQGRTQPGERFLNETVGWSPTCGCNHSEAHVTPCTVLDIFSGAGTTALVAAKLGRDAIGIELNPDYIAMSIKRLKAELGMMAEIQFIKHKKL